MRNQELIKKADIALSDLASNGGLLNPEQNNTFIRTLIEQPTLLNSIRTVAMKSPVMNINKIGFGSRLLQPAVSSTAAATRSKPDQSQVQLSTKEVIAEIHIPYEVMEDNIEGGNVNVPLQGAAGGLHQTIIELLAQRASTDLEELGIQGDTTSSDAYLALNNGFLKLATANHVDGGAASFSKSTVLSGLKAMPPRYLRNRAAMVHFVSVNNESNLRDQYAGRMTALGDQNVQGNLPLYVYGSGVTGVPLMPQASGLYTNPQNLIFGIQRNIMLEYDKDIRARVFIIVLTARIAFAIEEVNACVLYSNLGA